MSPRSQMDQPTPHRSRDFAGADARLKVAGSAVYTVDVRLPRMLHAKVLRSAHAHARILSVDVAAARRLPGVRAVITAADLPATARGRRVLAEGRVLSRADAVAAVAADTEEIASRALELIDVRYEPLPGVFDVLDALDPAAPTLYPGRVVPALPPEQAARLNNVASYGRVQLGDVERAFAESDVVVEEEYRTPMVHQGYLEPRAAVATADPTGKVVVWSSTQVPFGTRAALANVLGLPLWQVAVRTGLVGGGFGGKVGLLLEPLAALLAMATGRPVRLVNTRYEEFQAGSPRPATLIRIKTGARRDGTLLARQIVAFADGGCTGAGWAARIPILTLGPYRIPNVLAECYDVFTNNIPPGACRAPSAPPAVFAGESNLDSVAWALGMDPLEIRLRNAWRDGDTTATGQVVEQAPVAEALRKVSARIGWGEPKAGPNRGRGVAAGWWQSGPGNSTVVLLLNADGSAQLVTGAIDQGPGSAMTGLPLVVARELGIRPEQVEVVLAGTDRGPHDAGSGGSRVTVNLGIAAWRAALDVRRQLVEMASAELRAPAARLVVEDGAIRDPETGSSVPVAALAATAYASGQIVGRGSCSTRSPAYDPSRVVGNVWTGQSNPACFAQAAEVEVDADTGQVRVLRVATAQDVGYAINRTAIEGQIEGGTLQGIAQAVYEEMTTEAGRVANPDLSRYAMPTALEAPEFLVDVLESRREEGVAGVKGVGEQAICTTPAVIANAVRDAIGAPVRRLPLSGERVLEAIEQAGESGAARRSGAKRRR